MCATLATYEVAVTATGIVPAVIYTGTEGSVGKTIGFDFSSDWDGYTKEVMFYDTRGNVYVSPLVVDLSGNYEIPIPSDLTMYGGPHKFTVRGFTIDSGYINDSLQVTGTIVTAYTPGSNPRMEGRLLPSTMDLWLYQADNAVRNSLQAAKDSGEFNGADGADGSDGQNGVSAGFGTPTATAHSVPQGSVPTVDVTASGTDVEKIFAFEFGIPESSVYYMQILGHYASLEALQAGVPNPKAGDAYSVGASTPYNVYVYDGASHTWANYGVLDGGGSVTVDTAMSSSSTNAVQNKIIKAYVDGSIPASLKNPNALTIFGAAYDGSSAVTVTMDSSMSGSSTNAVQNKIIKAYVDDLIGDIDTALTAINALIGTPAE